MTSVPGELSYLTIRDFAAVQEYVFFLLFEVNGVSQELLTVQFDSPLDMIVPSFYRVLHSSGSYLSAMVLIASEIAVIRSKSRSIFRRTLIL